jgi:DNA-binding transcriptional LysR family regulator
MVVLLLRGWGAAVSPCCASPAAVSKADAVVRDAVTASTERATVPGPMDLDLRKLRSFVAVAEHLHFRRAAEALHIAQPALSRQIRALERELGVQLFDRDQRSTALTAAGRQLLDDARPLLAAADATRRRVQRAARGAHHLVVGFRAGITVTAATQAFAARRPEVTVEVRRLEWDEQEDLVRSGRVDIAYVRRPIDERGLRLIPLFSEDRLAALPRTHPLAGRAALSVRDLAGVPHLRYLEPAPAQGGTLLRSVEEKLEHVASGHGIIVLPRSATAYYTRPDVVYVPLTDAEPDEVYLACEAGRRTKLLSDFVAAAQSVAPAHALAAAPAG